MPTGLAGEPRAWMSRFDRGSCSQTQTCALTGASGFVGRHLNRALQRFGWGVVAWTRQPESRTDGVPFHLGQAVDAESLKCVRALVQCAHDFNPRKWEEISAFNVMGSEEPFRAARLARVESVLFTSTLSAFEGCRSLYGQAKLPIKRLAHCQGAFVIQPGPGHGEGPGRFRTQT